MLIRIVASVPDAVTSDFSLLLNDVTNISYAQHEGSAADTKNPLVSFPILISLLVFVGAAYSRTALADADSYWHVGLGRWIMQHREIPVRDVFSFSAPGIPWTVHEWLSELLMYGAYSVGGWQGLQLLTSVAFALTAGYMVRFLLDRMEPIYAITTAVLCLAVVNSHYLARPHVIVWPLTVVWVGTLVQCGETKQRPPWWLLPVLVFWANLHASFTLGFGFACALAADAVLRNETMVDRIASARKWALFLFASFLCLLVNPRGFGALTHALGVMRLKSTLAIVSEWQSANFHEFQFFLVWLLALLAVALTGRLKLSFIRTVFILGLIYLALKHQRYHALAGLISPFILAEPLAAAIRTIAKPTDQNVGSLDRVFATFSKRASKAGLLLGGAAMVLLGFAVQPLMPKTPNPFTTPEKALLAIQATGVPGNIFNAYGLGGYLIYREVPVFIDGRGDMYGDSFMEAVRDATSVQVPGALEAILKKYDIGYTMLGAKTPAIALLDHLPEWQRLYSDSVATVHVRRNLITPAAPASK